jgi:hypothetical protein
LGTKVRGTKVLGTKVLFYWAGNKSPGTKVRGSKVRGTKVLQPLIGHLNFHPDEQLFQVASAGDRTIDPWFTRSELSPYTTGDSHCQFLLMLKFDFIELRCGLRFDVLCATL